MAVSWKIMGKVVHLDSDESATFDEWVSAVDASLNDARVQPGMAVVHDLRRMVRIPSTQEAAARAAFLEKKARKHGVVRWAAVVAPDAHFGMARMAEVFIDGMPVEFRAFLTLEDAREWAQGRSSDTPTGK